MTAVKKPPPGASGLLAARPVATAQNVGLFYFATDASHTGALYLSNGSTWVRVTPMLSQLFGWYSLADYGPTADGVTSDNAAWAACYAAVVANGGGTIWIPRLTTAGYRLSVCQVTQDNVTIEVESGVKIQYAPYPSTDPCIFKLGDSTNGHYNRCYIHCSGKFTIDGSDQTGVPGSDVMNGVHYLNIRDGGVEGMDTVGLVGTAPNSIYCSMNSGNSSPYRATFKRIGNWNVGWKGGSTVQIGGGFDITCEDHHSDGGATVRIETDGNPGAVVDGVYAQNCSTNGDGGNPNSLWFCAAHSNTVRNVHFRNGRAAGKAHLLQMSYDSTNPYPPQACSMSHARVTGGGSAICFSTVPNQYPLDMVFSHITVEWAAASGTVFGTGAGFDVSGGRYYDCHARYCEAGGFRPLVNSPDAARADFTGCTAEGNANWGWFVSQASPWYFHDCKASQPVGDPPPLLGYQETGEELGSSGPLWISIINDTVARTTSQAHSGSASLQHTSTGSGVCGARTTVLYQLVNPGATMFAEAYTRANTTSRFSQMLLRWYDSTGTFISDTVGTAVTATNSAWAHITVTGAPPAGAVYVRPVVEFTGTTVGEIFYSDDHVLRLNVWPYSQDYAINVDAGKTAYLDMCDLSGAIGVSTGAGTVVTLAVP